MNLAEAVKSDPHEAKPEESVQAETANPTLDFGGVHRGVFFSTVGWDSTHFFNVPESHRRWRRSFTHMSKVSGPVRVAATGRSEACEGGS